MLLHGRLTDIDIKNTFTSSIDKNVFENCTNLKSIKLPQYLIMIGESAFSGCVNLSKIEFPQSLELIMRGAFYGCSSLESLVFPRHIFAIGAYAFVGCDNISEIHFLGTKPPSVSIDSFSNYHYKNSILFVPKGYKEEFALTDGWIYFKDIKEENIENTCLLTIHSHDGARCLFVCPSADYEGWNSTGHGYYDGDVIELEKGENVFLAVDLWLQNKMVYVEKILINGENKTNSLLGPYKCLLQFTIKKDSEIDIYMTPNKPTSDINIKKADLKIYTYENQINIENINPGSSINIYDIQGNLYRHVIPNSDICNIVLPKNRIYIIQIEKESFKIKL